MLLMVSLQPTVNKVNMSVALMLVSILFHKATRPLYRTAPAPV